MAASHQPRPSVQLLQGKVKGTILTDKLPRPVEAFRGIPYALPPVGDLRFRPAVKVAACPEAVIDAVEYGPAAPCKPLFAGGPEPVYSEDCLTMNIFRPCRENTMTRPLLPVAIYFHGGAFNRGTSSMHNTASMLAWSDVPIILVSFNYRLGALGFLPSSITAREGVLNLGLRDQILAMEWVTENIEAFGGDPKSITLFGLSAGAHSVSSIPSCIGFAAEQAAQIGHHIMNYKDGQAPLFHRVIIESGAPTSRAVRPYDAPIHEAQFRDFLAEVGCPDNLPEEEIFPFLRAVPSAVLWAAQIAVFNKYNPSLRWAFQPVIDGNLIQRPPLETWHSGKWHHVPIMTGFTRNEGSLYVNKQCAKSSEFTNFFKELLPLLDSFDMATIEKLYPDPSVDPRSAYLETRDGVGAQYKRLEAAYANYAYVAPVRQTAELASSSMTAPVYLYQWALESSVIGGAQHSDNMRYEVCDPKVMGISPTQRTLARILNAYTVSFIAHGDPNVVSISGMDRLHWQKYSSKMPMAMVFGAGNKELVGGGAGPASELLPDTWAREESEFWWSKVNLSQQQ